MSMTDSDQGMGWDAFGGYFRRMRKRRGLSQERLANLLNCHRTHIYRIERGERRPSRVFLRLGVAMCGPSPEEMKVLRHFERLRETQYDALGQDS